ncbi:BnaA06g23990D [Brassica napus]|uniref:(rape) hypothetical protein n=1 Tax=Brassica napus TaxID=3708 RepID=A0A078F2T1_BRANA|nr:unnamed protein product [Brassica napus]CDY08825.1 BnaA06g23990D [Brassica napus]
MGRKKVEIKRIENKSSRQVTFCKRRNGLIEKARQLSVLCESSVAVLVVSATGKLYNSSSGDKLNNVVAKIYMFLVFVLFCHFVIMIFIFSINCTNFILILHVIPEKNLHVLIRAQCCLMVETCFQMGRTGPRPSRMKHSPQVPNFFETLYIHKPPNLSKEKRINWDIEVLTFPEMLNPLSCLTLYGVSPIFQPKIYTKIFLNRPIVLSKIIDRYKIQQADDLQTLDLEEITRNYLPHKKLLELVQSNLEEANVDGVSVDSLNSLEEQLETALSVTRTTKTKLMMEFLKTRREKEKLLIEENLVLASKVTEIWKQTFLVTRDETSMLPEYRFGNNPPETLSLLK